MAGTPARAERDRRSLAQQLAEDDVIELPDDMVQDTGGGVTKFLREGTSEPGFSPGQVDERRRTSGLLACDFPDDPGVPTDEINP